MKIKDAIKVKKLLKRYNISVSIKFVLELFSYGEIAIKIFCN